MRQEDLIRTVLKKKIGNYDGSTRILLFKKRFSQFTLFFFSICITEGIELQSSSSSGIENIIIDNSYVSGSFNEFDPSNSKNQEGERKSYYCKTYAALDKYKLSDRCAVRIITAIVEALHHNLNELTINHTSIQRCPPSYSCKTQ